MFEYSLLNILQCVSVCAWNEHEYQGDSLLCLRTKGKNVRIHHHHVVPLARISLTLSRHFSLSFIVSGMSSRLHPVYSHSCCMYVRAGRPAFARPYVGVHMSSSLLFHQCPAYLVRLTWIVFVMGGKWPYSCCFVSTLCVLPSGHVHIVQYCSQNFCVIAVKILLQPFCKRSSGASIQQYRHDRCLKETAFHFIGHTYVYLLLSMYTRRLNFISAL